MCCMEQGFAYGSVKAPCRRTTPDSFTDFTVIFTQLLPNLGGISTFLFNINVTLQQTMHPEHYLKEASQSSKLVHYCLWILVTNGLTSNKTAAFTMLTTCFLLAFQICQILTQLFALLAWIHFVG